MRAGVSSGPLPERIVAALTSLIRGLDPVFFRDKIADPRRALVSLSTVLLRVVVLAVADARGLTSERGVSARLRRELRAGQAWARLFAVCGALSEGLFAPRLTAAIEGAAVADEAVIEAIEGLLGADDAWADVEIEAIGAAYEALLGLDLRAAKGPTLVLAPDQVGVDLAALLGEKPSDRAARVEAIAGGAVRARAAAALAGARSIEEIAAALARRVSLRFPELIPAGALYIEPGLARRRAGAHYTPRAITREIVARALAPLLDRGAEVLLDDLAIADPAMGAGAFLVEACRQLGARVAAAGIDPAEARRLVAERCLFGVDKDPLAVELARASLWLFAGAKDRPLSFVDHALRCGDALIGAGFGEDPREIERALPSDHGAFHWPLELPRVAARGGFDAIVGNPPWVAYAGRAAQPLPDDLHAFYARRYASFHGYRTLHGLFVHRAASLLRPGGRLGLVVPTSMSDLGGYDPARRAHDAIAEADGDLPDFGDAFTGVFQPSMGLLSTRRRAPITPGRGSWSVARDDLDAPSRALLARLSALPPLPAACFGERGFQSSGDDAARFASAGSPSPPFVVPIREGADLRAFRALAPRLYLDPAGLAGRLRDEAVWREVAILVRQTARFPIAALADGIAFRNSILAGFAVGAHDRFTLVAWLNAAPIRWLHFTRFRDARQGMPQVKIAHLRAIPAVPAPAITALAAIGERLGARNAGASITEQTELDEAAADALDLSREDRAIIAAWAAKNPAP